MPPTSPNTPADSGGAAAERAPAARHRPGGLASGGLASGGLASGAPAAVASAAVASAAVASAAVESVAPAAVAAAEPIEPPPGRWVFPDGVDAIAEATGGGEVVGVGADLEAGTILAAYRHGLFPMPVRRGLTAWWSPNERGVLPLDGLRVSRSLRKSCARFEIRVDSAAAEVIDACADRHRPGAWITKDIKRAYLRLHQLGWVHTVEAWSGDGHLAGGLYGVAIGGLFAGESMFHRQTDASKVALVALVDRLRGSGASLLDVQWVTPHLASLGVVAIPRVEYHRRLALALCFARASAWVAPAETAD